MEGRKRGAAEQEGGHAKVKGQACLHKLSKIGMFCYLRIYENITDTKTCQRITREVRPTHGCCVVSKKEGARVRTGMRDEVNQKERPTGTACVDCRRFYY